MHPSSALPFMTLPAWVEAAKACGFEMQPILSSAGIAIDLLHLESTPIEQVKIKDLMLACVAAARRGHFPLALGQAQTTSLTYLPEIQTFFKTSPSLREALRVFEWVRRLINPRLSVRLKEDADLAWIVVEFAGDPSEADVERYFAEAIIAAGTTVGTALIGNTDWCKQIWFRHPEPANRAVYADYLPARPDFSRSMYAVAVARPYLDLPLAGAWPELHVQAHLRLQQRYVEGARTSGISARVERAFDEEPSLLQKDIGAVALHLSVNPRTLQRRLKQEGEGFASLRDRARVELASRLLREGEPPIDVISERLGFSDRRAFTRAFTRWVGMSPSAFRRKG